MATITTPATVRRCSASWKAQTTFAFSALLGAVEREMCAEFRIPAKPRRTGESPTVEMIDEVVDFGLESWRLAEMSCRMVKRRM